MANGTATLGASSGKSFGGGLERGGGGNATFSNRGLAEYVQPKLSLGPDTLSKGSSLVKPSGEKHTVFSSEITPLKKQLRIPPSAEIPGHKQNVVPEAISPKADSKDTTPRVIVKELPNGFGHPKPNTEIISQSESASTENPASAVDRQRAIVQKIYEVSASKKPQPADVDVSPRIKPIEDTLLQTNDSENEEVGSPKTEPTPKFEALQKRVRQIISTSGESALKALKLKEEVRAKLAEGTPSATLPILSSKPQEASTPTVQKVDVRERVNAKIKLLEEEASKLLERTTTGITSRLTPDIQPEPLKVTQATELELAASQLKGAISDQQETPQKQEQSVIQKDTHPNSKPETEPEAKTQKEIPYSEAERELAERKNDATKAIQTVVAENKSTDTINGHQIVGHLPEISRRTTSPIVDVGKDITDVAWRKHTADIASARPDRAVTLVHEIINADPPVKRGDGRSVAKEHVRRIVYLQREAERPRQSINEAAQ